MAARKKPTGKGSDRRESPRVELSFRARAKGGTRWVTYEGDVGLGGVRAKLPHPPFGTEVELALKLPGLGRELRLDGVVLRVTGSGHDFDAHIRFDEMDVEDELALAKFLDESDAAE